MVQSEITKVDMAHSLMKPINISSLHPSAVFQNLKSDNLLDFTVEMSNGHLRLY